MVKSWNFHKSLFYIFCILIGIDIVRRSYVNIDVFIFSIFLFMVILVNNHLRMTNFYKTDKSYFLSIIATMIASSVLILKIEGYTGMYIYIILYELILFTQGKVSITLTSLEIMFFFFILLYEGIERQYIIGTIMDSVLLLFYVFMLYTYKNLRIEKRKVELLNKEIEELTIAKERNRLAGEIHDTMGHNLVALNMNLDVTNKILDKDIDKAKELIYKSQSLTKESIENLRMAVYALREDRTLSLKESITKLIDNFPNNDEPRFITEVDEAVETLPTEYKEILFTSIKESITNSIKHGNPELITINISCEDSKLIVSIKDNGTGCIELVKGNGLLGIEDRIENIGGNVDYIFKDNIGFEVVFAFDSKNFVGSLS